MILIEKERAQKEKSQTPQEKKKKKRRAKIWISSKIYTLSLYGLIIFPLTPLFINFLCGWNSWSLVLKFTLYKATKYKIINNNLALNCFHLNLLRLSYGTAHDGFIWYSKKILTCVTYLSDPGLNRRALLIRVIFERLRENLNLSCD